MRPTFKQFLVQNIILSLVILAIGIPLAFSVIPGLMHPLSPLILLFAFMVNVLLFRLILGKKDVPLNMTMAITKSFALKFFSYIALVVIIVLAEKNKDQILLMVVTVFIHYILFTIIEVRAFTTIVRKKESS